MTGAWQKLIAVPAMSWRKPWVERVTKDAPPDTLRHTWDAWRFRARRITST